MYIKRAVEPILLKYINKFPVCGVTGPRQSGKSTLLKHALDSHYRYICFDDPRLLSFFNEDPAGFMAKYDRHVIFDEAQLAPELFNYLKLSVDQNRQDYGRFIVTGSNQFSMLQSITESLAGRIGLLTLLPFQYQELPTEYRDAAIYKGSYPELSQLKYKETEDWYASYIQTYLDRDVRGLHHVGNLRDFHRLLNLLAANTSQTLNLSHYAHDIGVSVPLIKKWISVLEASYVIFLLPPYYENYGKRIVKSPKIYFFDTGLAAFLTGIKNQELYEQGPMAGPLFENYVVAEVVKKTKHLNNHAELYYYRSSQGFEIDLIVDFKTHRDIIEIKKNASFKPTMVKSVKAFLKPNDTGYLLYSGEDFPYLDKIKVKNYRAYLIN